jgi:predicted RNA binding protein YcfA (HicA-like mRNA interferase family)
VAPDFCTAVLRERRAAGYVVKKGGKGSHEKWVHPDSGRTMIVPFNLKSRHTANAILKDIGSPVRL